MANRISTDVAHKRWWQTFEVVFGVPFLAAIALQLAVPFSLPRALLTPAIIPAGAALIIVVNKGGMNHAVRFSQAKTP
jgi:hypothetical protein